MPTKETYKSLDALVEAEDFMSLTEDAYNELLPIIQHCALQHQHSRAQVEATLRALNKQLDHAEFPNETANAYLAVYHVMKHLKSIVIDAEDRGIQAPEVYTRAHLVPVLKELFYTCVGNRPSSGHFHVIWTLMSDWNLKDNYTMILRGEEVKRYMDILKNVYQPNTTDSDVESNNLTRYQRNYSNLYRLLISDWLSDDASDLEEWAPWFAEVISFYVHQTETEVDDNVAKLYKDIAGTVRLNYRHAKVEIYTSIKDPNLLSSHLQEIKKILSDDKFPRHEPSSEAVNSWLDHLICPFKKKVADAMQFVQLYVDILYVVNDKVMEQVFRKMGHNLAYACRDVGPEVTVKATVDYSRLITQIENLDLEQKEATEQIMDTIEYTVKPKLKLGNDVPDIVAVMCALLRKPDTKTIQCCRKLVDTGKKAKIKWKDHADHLQTLVKATCEAAVSLGDKDNSSLSSVLQMTVDFAVKGKVLRSVNRELVQALLTASKEINGNYALLDALSNIMEQVDWKMDLEGAHKVYSILPDVITSSTLTNAQGSYLSVASGFLLKSAPHIVEARATAEFVSDVVTMAEASLAALLKILDEDEEIAQAHLVGGLFSLLALIPAMCMEEASITALLPVVFKIIEAEIDVNSLSKSLATMLHLVCTKCPVSLDRYISKIVDRTCDEEGSTAQQYASFLVQVYPHCSENIHQGLGKLLGEMTNHNMPWTLVVMQLIMKVAKENPQAIHKEHVDQLIDSIDLRSLAEQIYHTFKVLSEKCPEILVPVQDSLIQKAFPGREGCQAFTVLIIGATGQTNETQAERSLDDLCGLLQMAPDNLLALVLVGMKDIGTVYNDKLTPRRATILSVKEKHPLLTETCDYMLDIIEGRSLAGLSEELTEQKAEIQNVKIDVTETGEKVDNLTSTVDSQGRDIEDIKEDVTKVEDRLEEVEETVEETVQKVEEIDHKTMTNAPAWSRDVSLLLNPETEQDWRLLAQRLGYSNDDIRGWATQNDPCMSVLSEWYATHKTREATHAVLKALEEMDREDAAQVIHRAKEEADGVIEEDEEEAGPLPPVFLSYQWSHQPHVRLLKRHLESAGFRCWMDTGQMGGGDKLFSKIDAGMRAAAVIICCVSEKYAKSDNCNREVNLAINLGKPIIPLLMEKMKWPPEGSMGPIFGEYLFIRFNQRSGEETGDERFWPAAKFEELLMQLRYSVAPDEDIISEDYQNWWSPQTEPSIVIPPAAQSQGGGGIQQNGTEHSQGEGQTDSSGSEQPEVFLSYQWGKQSQIKALFSQLSALGYPCWMDIYQMGGGDSLYEKIDKGVRNARVVVACVTPKYALSANCRREVSLADALKKPIIPILLDTMTWPPEGPMSMVMTQLLYIGFDKEPQDQTKWTGAKFEELLQKINEHVTPRSGESLVEHPGEEKPQEKEIQKDKECSPVAREADTEQKTPRQDTSHSEPEPIPRPPSGRPPSAKSRGPAPPANSDVDKPAKSKSCVIL